MEQSISIAPLITFRIGFGLVMLFSTIRYISLGWVETQLIDPVFHFNYYGFSWVKVLPGYGMYIVFGLMILSCISIVMGWHYRVFSILFFLCFTYVELIDITYYLNHYYFVSIVSFLLILVPSNGSFSLDAVRNPALKKETVSRWCIGIFKLQIAIVYCYAGLAKINQDWLLEALPLSIWLPAKTSIPIIGFMFQYELTAYLFSWLGMLFDTFIIGLLLWKKTRCFAYVVVVVFHSITGILFQIGVFPIIMIFAVTIFFSSDFHEKLLLILSRILPDNVAHSTSERAYSGITKKIIFPFLIAFFIFQLLFPWRNLLYGGNVFWTEEGYRFAWRVMLMEKAGTATFYVKDGERGREGSVINHQFLNAHQEKQMAMQPDMILQFAHYLAAHYKKEGMQNPTVRVEAWVTLNGRPAQYLIDPTADLIAIKDTWKKKNWILPFAEKEME